jgi:ADP-ribosylglycohydrolase
MRSINAHDGHYDRDSFLDQYIALMTSDSPAHPDTYAESFHRGFFANYEQGLPPDQCAMVTHDTASIGGLVMIAPIVIAERMRGTSLQAVQDICRAHLYLTHPDEFLAEVCDQYVKLIDHLLFAESGACPTEALLTATRGVSRRDLTRLIESGRDDYEIIGRVLSPACYITDSWPAVLYLACRYRDDALKALLINTNVGGDNVHRGAVLGVLSGLINGFEPAGLFERLTEYQSINREIERLLLSGAPTE